MALAFRPVGDGDGTRWAAQRLSAGAAAFAFGLDLFGVVQFTDSAGLNLVPSGSRVPLAPREAGAAAARIPKRREAAPEYIDPSGWRDDTK